MLSLFMMDNPQYTYKIQHLYPVNAKTKIAGSTRGPGSRFRALRFTLQPGVLEGSPAWPMVDECTGWWFPDYMVI